MSKHIIIEAESKVVKSCDAEITLTYLQKAVGGYITMIPLSNGDYMVVNEEGMFLHLKPVFFVGLSRMFTIYGNAVIIGKQKKKNHDDCKTCYNCEDECKNDFEII